MDRTFRGLTAGIIAGIAMNIWNVVDYYFLHMTHILLLDYVAVLTSGNRSMSVFQAIIDLIVQIIWDGYLGIVFSHLITKITSQGIIIKSVLYGTLCWFFFRVVVVLFRIDPLIKGEGFFGRFSHLLGAILWGAVLGILLKKFEKEPAR